MADRTKVIRIEWTEPARTDLKEVSQFLLNEQNIPIHIVERIINRLFDKVQSLSKFPQIGQLEPLLMNANLNIDT